MGRKILVYFGVFSGPGLSDVMYDIFYVLVYYSAYSKRIVHKASEGWICSKMHVGRGKQFYENKDLLSQVPPSHLTDHTICDSLRLLRTNKTNTFILRLRCMFNPFIKLCLFHTQSDSVVFLSKYSPVA